MILKKKKFQKKLPCYNKLREDFRNAIHEFTTCISDSSEEIGYDEGDTDHDMHIMRLFNKQLMKQLDGKIKRAHQLSFFYPKIHLASWFTLVS